MTARSTGSRTAALLATLVAVFLLLGQSAVVVSAKQPDGPKRDTKELRKELRESGQSLARAEALSKEKKDKHNRAPRVGDVRTWVALDDTAGYYLKDFKLRDQSPSAEVWTALDLSYPEGDCRNNDPDRVNISNKQVRYILRQFDRKIRPTDTDWFGDPVERTGRNGLLPGILGINQNAYRDNKGRDVILVDNVRDDNFYDTNNANSLPRIGGFFSSIMIDYHDRDVITLDSYDWIARTGGDPVHTPSADPCVNSPARPFLFEGTLAHEYQHLIHNDYDPDEENWVNEGMSDFAEILTGYSDPSLHMDQEGNDSHIQGFLGWLNAFHPEWNPIPSETGPENSLTAWEDQDKPAEIFEDYGFAYYFMTYLQSQGYDQAFFTAWHHNLENGVAGLDSTLAANGSSDTFRSLFTDVAVSALVDGFIDNGASVSGADAANLQNDATEATIFSGGDAYDTAGAPPWGSDYVPLGAGAGLTSVAFNGDEEFVFPAGPEWVVDADGYWTNPDEAGATTYEANLDADITRAVTVSGAGTLEFDHFYETEPAWDYGFVQVSTDGGTTFTSVACTGTTTDHDPGAIASIVAQLPGYTGGPTGDAATPVHATCTLPTGNILLSFRFMSDPGVNLDGWHVKNVTIDGTAVDASPEDLADWDNQAFFNPAELEFILQVVGFTGTVDAFGDPINPGAVVVVRPTLGEDNTASLSSADLAALAGSSEVVAIVSGVPQDDTSRLYSPYSLLVNGAERADGEGL